MEITTPIRSVLAGKQPTVWTARPVDTVFDAITLMSKRNVGALPVLNDTQLFGIVSERDYTRKVILRGRSSRETLVSEIMTREVIVVKPHFSVQECMRLMTEHHVRHLPVVENGQLTGMLSVGDVVTWIIEAQQMALTDMEHLVTGAYPA